MKFDFNRLFDDRKFLFIISLIIAIGIWTTISLTIDPNQNETIKDVPITVPISDSNAEVLGLDVVSGEDQKVSVLIYGKRYKVGNLKNSDFIVSADISKVRKAGEVTVTLSAVLKEKDEDYRVVSVSPPTIKLRFDHVIEKEIALKTDAPDITAKAGFIKGEPTASVEKITIKGPETDINKVDSAVLITDQKEELSETRITDKVKVLFYDSENNKVDLSTISYTPTDLQLTIPILKEKTVNLIFEYRNVPQDFPVKELKYTMSKSTLKVVATGEAATYVKDINLGSIDFRTIGLGSDFSFDIPLPSGFKSMEDVKKVKIHFDPAGLATKNFSTKNFKIDNPPSNLSVSLETKSLGNIKIIGEKNIVKSLSSQDIVATIDLLNDVQITQKGRTKVPVRIAIPGKGMVWAMGEYSAIILAK